MLSLPKSLLPFPCTTGIAALESVRQLREVALKYSVLDQRASVGTITYEFPMVNGNIMRVTVNCGGIEAYIREECSGFSSIMMRSLFENTVGPLIVAIQKAHHHMTPLYKDGVILARKADKSICIGIVESIWRQLPYLDQLRVYIPDHISFHEMVV